MSPMETPALETARLRLAPFADRHVTEAYVGWLNDPETMRYSENRHRSFTLESCATYVKSFPGSPNHLWAIELREGGRHIGNISAHVDPPNSLADVGIVMGERSEWGKGFGLEAWNAVCAWLLGAGGMRKVTGGTLSTNTAMIRILERAGMTPDGRRLRQYLNDGQEVDVVYAALFAKP